MLDTTVYCFDETIAVWRKAQESRGFCYTDGLEIEESLLLSVQASKDRSSGSDELASRIVNWPSEYHFSPYRQNLLAPFSFQGADVLEVGAGCGALTRFLGESGAQVTALEGSLKRASIASARCIDLPNVTVICDDFRDFVSGTAFDCIVAVGVLEYASYSFEGPGAVNDFLKKSLSLLKPTGALVLGIENQLGLKYFSGCAEDHTGHQFFGIEDRYRETQGPITFGRVELAEKLARTGFSDNSFFYPFPDYKLPRVIVSQEGARDRFLRVGRMIGESASRDYKRPKLRLFAEDAAWEVLDRNGLVQDLANSFLVFASPRERSKWVGSLDWLTKSFSVGRLKRFRTMTTFRREDRQIRVYKQLLHPDSYDCSAAESLPVRLRVPSESAFVPGRTLKNILARKLRNPNATLDDVVATLQPWLELLRENVLPEVDTGGRCMLPGTFIDCVPWNVVQGSCGKESVTFIDAEWEWESAIRLALPIVRGFLHLDLQTVEPKWLSAMARSDLILTVASRVGIPLSASELPALVSAGADFLAAVTPHSAEDLRRHYQDVIQSPYTAAPTLDDLVCAHDASEADLIEATRQLDRVLNSVSWRITKPLRRAYDYVTRRVRQRSS